MIRKKHGIDGNEGMIVSDCHVQLELPIFQAQAAIRRPSAEVIPFRQRPDAEQHLSAREDALRRILDFARTLPGK